MSWQESYKSKGIGSFRMSMNDYVMEDNMHDLLNIEEGCHYRYVEVNVY